MLHQEAVPPCIRLEHFLLLSSHQCSLSLCSLLRQIGEWIRLPFAPLLLLANFAPQATEPLAADTAGLEEAAGIVAAADIVVADIVVAGMTAVGIAELEVPAGTVVAAAVGGSCAGSR